MQTIPKVLIHNHLQDDTVKKNQLQEMIYLETLQLLQAEQVKKN